jgi:hypothetical protein
LPLPSSRERRPGDQIGRIFAVWAIFGKLSSPNWGQFLEQKNLPKIHINNATIMPSHTKKHIFAITLDMRTPSMYATYNCRDIGTKPAFPHWRARTSRGLQEETLTKLWQPRRPHQPDEASWAQNWSRFYLTVKAELCGLWSDSSLYLIVTLRGFRIKIIPRKFKIIVRTQTNLHLCFGGGNLSICNFRTIFFRNVFG